MNFATRLEQGKTGESLIARWLMSRGKVVLPVYEKIIDEGKGPRLFTGSGDLVAPDMLAITNERFLWIEAKHKEAFTWYRIASRFETGIDLRHYEDYVRVAELTDTPLWVLFLHRGGQAKDSPPSPSGLYGNEIGVLQTNESHRSEEWGMVYWTREEDGGALKRLASYEDVLSVARLTDESHLPGTYSPPIGLSEAR